MKKKLEQALERVKKRAEKLSEAERDALTFEAQDNPAIIFEHIKNCHAVELYCVTNAVPETLHQKDAFGMTPLHVSNLDQSGLATAILTENPHASIWEQDDRGRIPLDVAEQFENMESIAALTRCTYPHCIKVMETDEQELQRLEKFDAFRKENMERAKTTPGWLREEFELGSEISHRPNLLDADRER